MKTLILFLLLLVSFTGKSQTFSCGTPYSPPNEHPLPPDFVYDPDAVHVVNVFFNLIKDDEGNIETAEFNYTFGENEVMEVVKALNVTFNPYKIFFKYTGMNVVNNTYITNTGTFESGLSAYYRNDAYNIYIVNNANGYAAYAGLGHTSAVFCYASLTPMNLYETVPHEMGHCFNLLHIFDPNVNNFICERVTRDPSDPEFNADWAGDGIVDTPAQPPLSDWNFTDCVYNYNPDMTDCIGVPYVNIRPHNYMGYDAYGPCEMHFTPGQVKAMRSYLQNPHSFTNTRNTFTTIESLYMPFETTLIGTNEIVSSTPYVGGSYVCRKTGERNRFQKGFDYVFYNTAGTTTATVNDLPDRRDSYSFFVKINQVDPNVFRKDFVVYNTTICANEPYIKGRVTSTPMLGSMNFTQKELNETEVNDPNLYNNLPEQTFHIISRQTESGTETQQVIYKP